jgi:hypothetical protein
VRSGIKTAPGNRGWAPKNRSKAVLGGRQGVISCTAGKYPT